MFGGPETTHTVTFCASVVTGVTFYTEVVPENLDPVGWQEAFFENEAGHSGLVDVLKVALLALSRESELIQKLNLEVRRVVKVLVEG